NRNLLENLHKKAAEIRFLHKKSPGRGAFCAKSLLNCSGFALKVGFKSDLWVKCLTFGSRPLSSAGSSRFVLSLWGWLRGLRWRDLWRSFSYRFCLLFFFATVLVGEPLASS